MRYTRVILSTVLLASLLTGCSLTKITRVESTQKPPVANAEPAGAVQLPEIAGDMAALKGALSEPSAVKYTIRVVADTGGKDATAAFEGLEAQVGKLEPDVMLIAVFPGLNHDMRFALGAAFHQKQVTPEDVLTLVRSEFLPEARKADPATGLAKLIRSVNNRMK